MRILAAALVTFLSLTGTAHAAPAPSPLTKNPLYKTGKLPAQTCEEPEVNQDHDAIRLYVEAITACQEKAWSTQVTKAGFRYQKAKVVVKYGDRIKTACGVYHPDDVYSLYCIPNKTIYLMLTDYGLADELDSPEILESLSIGYGYHAQNMVGIVDQEDRAAKKLPKAKALALTTKGSLQSICLAGAFIGSVWDSLGHSRAHGSEYFINRHAVEGNYKGFGTAKNRVYWQRRGFDAASPSACNTYTAPASKVR
ncbi:neutral zinc metallopeptidase [Nonomuraea sp. NPDC049269]|uniref:neutral zinc metallopeptidase n=1 Tax=Nonomuraea sp. NPDC049269 TaxID=3364349 RepID=UPI00371529ED